MAKSTQQRTVTLNHNKLQFLVTKRWNTTRKYVKNREKSDSLETDSK